MNIRSLSNPAQVLAKEKLESADRIKSDQTEDREANGQQPFSDQESHRSLSDEELDLVLEKIRSNDGIEKNGLVVKLLRENDQAIVRIETGDGKVVRRFVERDLYFFLYESGEEEIHLVNKTA